MAVAQSKLKRVSAACGRIHFFWRHIIRRKPIKIDVIGDSHTLFWSGTDHNAHAGPPRPKKFAYRFNTHWVGPGLAYNLTRYGTTNGTREKIDELLLARIPKNAFLMLVFGEIDIRVHMLKGNREGTRQRIDKALYNYLAFCLELRDRGYHVICHGPIASQKDNQPMNVEFPRHGTERRRNAVTRLFNKKMETMCRDNGLLFFTLFDLTIEKNMATKAGVICDGCHLCTKKLYLIALQRFAATFSRSRMLRVVWNRKSGRH